VGHLAQQPRGPGAAAAAHGPLEPTHRGPAARGARRAPTPVDHGQRPDGTGPVPPARDDPSRPVGFDQHV
ncbi:MAG: hypothetical protein AVDCRST_MAG41-3258, partial [uncultured Corynebacteriales bacterium]